MAQATQDTEYNGPSVKDMIATHTLAENIINRQPVPYGVLDSSELVLLCRFVDNPESYNEILRDYDMVDTKNPEFIGQAAHAKGSLAGFVIARHEQYKHLTEGEIEIIREWFASGAVDEAMKSAKKPGESTDRV